LQQLGAKLETNLKLQETQLAQVPRTEAAKRRATLVKLNRDYRRVEAVYKNMVLDTKRRKAQRAQSQLQHNATARSSTAAANSNSGYGTTANQQEMSQEEQRMQLELQLQTDVSSSFFAFAPSLNAFLCFVPGDILTNHLFSETQ
jgi:hypothetical protein